ncbi:MAG: type II toxin-antitoxin system VapC family toxin [Bacteroidetes bacterium]|nr:type II toxin-antitoxin system VapC family toxin [Bacteroidota bacterium]
MKPRLYFDTSVFGGILDKEFEDVTTKLFDMVRRGEIVCVFSNLSETELEHAPEPIKDHFLSLPDDFTEYVEVTEEAFALANQYLEEKVVGPTSADDCRHIAVATLNKVDYLVSWNFKHIVNVFRIRGYNSINLKNGNIQLDIRSPKEIIKEDDE